MQDASLNSENTYVRRRTQKGGGCGKGEEDEFLKSIARRPLLWTEKSGEHWVSMGKEGPNSDKDPSFALLGHGYYEFSSRLLYARQVMALFVLGDEAQESDSGLSGRRLRLLFVRVQTLMGR